MDSNLLILPGAKALHPRNSGEGREGQLGDGVTAALWQGENIVLLLWNGFFFFFLNGTYHHRLSAKSRGWWKVRGPRGCQMCVLGLSTENGRTQIIVVILERETTTQKESREVTWVAMLTWGPFEIHGYNSKQDLLARLCIFLQQ